MTDAALTKVRAAFSVFAKRIKYQTGGKNMVRHMILWKLKAMSEEEKMERKKLVKEGLEGLEGQIPGMKKIHVRTEKLPSSTCDMMLDSIFESEEALKNYSVHPAHVKVAETRIRPYVEIRLCMDYEMEENEL